jgi:PAS domain-containing protein
MWDLERQNDFVLPKMGLFTWQLADNLLMADEVYAAFYGFEPSRLSVGVSIEEVIGRIFEEDREEVARATHRAILSGEFSTVPFRVARDGVVKTIVSFGRCLRDADGTPSIFTGGLFETTSTFIPGLQARTLCH